MKLTILLEETSTYLNMSDFYFDKYKLQDGFRLRSSFSSLAPDGKPRDEWSGELEIADMPITSLKGFPKKVKGEIRLSRLPITSLDGIGITTEWLHLNGLKIKNFDGLIDASNISISYCKLDNLLGLPDHLHNLVIGHCEVKSFEGFPKFVTNLKIFGQLGLVDPVEMSFKGIDKYIKAAGQISFDGAAIDENTPLLGFLNIAQLNNIEFKSRHSAKKDLSKAFDIINKYLPNGDIFDCQSELIEAGFKENAKV